MTVSFFTALQSNPLLLFALLAGITASLASGIIGSYVVAKRIVFISGSIAHSILGGIGFAIWLQRVHDIAWVTPLFGALAAALISSCIMGWVRLSRSQREDTIIAAIWSAGMAIGVIFLSMTPGFTSELTNYLIGNILWVSKSDLLFLIALDVIIVVAALIYHKKFLAICFDETEAKLQGLSTHNLYLLLLALTSITIVILMQVVGIILVITLLAIPPAIANSFTQRLSRVMLIAIGLNMFLCSGGLFASYHLNWPAGATIALFSVCVYGLSLFLPKSNS